MADNMKIDVPALRSLHRFGDIYAQAIEQVESDKVALTVDRASPDSIGAHWYGMRCHVECKATGQRFYLHTGLVFLPETRTGLMVEVDKVNNLAPYDQVWSQIKENPAYDINKDEPIYFKLFMPDADFAALQSMGRKQQAEKLSAFFKACAEGICEAAYTEGFRLDYGELANTLRLARAFAAALARAGGEDYSVEVNAKDPDNFGQYASGYRYWLRDKQSGNEMYAYFGGIYSYKKDPTGIFAEIDWLNNQKVFDTAFANMKSNEWFDFSNKEPKFIKLFMKPERVEAFNAAGAAEQQEMLNAFLDSCNAALVQAAR